MEIVILVGLQASGKSSFRRSRFDAAHVVVSKDNFRNHRRPARRQDQLIREALHAGKPVVVDNTNPRREDREALIRLAREFSVPAIGYFLRSNFEEALVRNARREGAARIPDVGVYSTAKVLVVPSLSEGFDELYEVACATPHDFAVKRMEAAR
jgi:predicted kinase